MKRREQAEVFESDTDPYQCGVSRGNAVIYEAQFSRRTAQALADLENGPRPPRTWKVAERRLLAAGFDLRTGGARERSGDDRPEAG
jgi:uncharacterized protein YifE (UPF0438 family)